MQIEIFLKIVIYFWLGFDLYINLDIIYIFAGVLNTFYSRLGKINLRANLNILARNWRVSQKLREKNVWENLILHTQTQKYV